LFISESSCKVKQAVNHAYRGRACRLVTTHGVPLHLAVFKRRANLSSLNIFQFVSHICSTRR